MTLTFRPVEYDVSKLKPFTPLCTNPNEMLENDYIKKLIWSFEKEYRSIIISPWNRYEHLKIYYPDEILSEIIFGFNVAADKINEIINLVKEKYSNYEEIKFYKTVPDRNKFKIEIVELK